MPVPKPSADPLYKLLRDDEVAAFNRENLGGAYIVGTELKLTLALVIIVAVLTVKPSGLMGRTVQSRV